MEGGYTRLFTVEEANGLLAELRPLVGRMRAAYRVLKASRRRLDVLMEKASLAGGSRVPPRLLKAMEDVETSTRSIQELGVVLKDMGAGLVDFPTAREGRIVFLCWRPGEEEVSYWHEVEGGYAGRQPL